MKRIIGVVCIVLLASVMVLAQVVRERTLTWEDPDNPPGSIVKYTIYFGTTSGGPYPNKIEVLPAALTAKTSLPKGTYFFVLTASNPDSESEFSNEASTTIFDNARKVLNFRILIP